MNPYIFKALPLTPVTLERIVASIPQSRHDDATDPDRFTLREAIAHLADWEPILLDRVSRTAEQDGYEIVPYDESEMAIKNNYAGQDVQESLRQFRDCRAKTVEYCKTLTEEQMARKALHPEIGILSVADILNQIIGHDLYHIEHLTQYLMDKTAGTW